VDAWMGIKILIAVAYVPQGTTGRVPEAVHYSRLRPFTCLPGRVNNKPQIGVSYLAFLDFVCHFSKRYFAKVGVRSYVPNCLRRELVCPAIDVSLLLCEIPTIFKTLIPPRRETFAIAVNMLGRREIPLPRNGGMNPIRIVIKLYQLLIIKPSVLPLLCAPKAVWKNDMPKQTVSVWDRSKRHATGSAERFGQMGRRVNWILETGIKKRKRRCQLVLRVFLSLNNAFRRREQRRHPIGADREIQVIESIRPIKDNGFWPVNRNLRSWHRTGSKFSRVIARRGVNRLFDFPVVFLFEGD